MANTVSAIGPGAFSAPVVASAAPAPAREVAAKKTVTAPSQVRAALAKAHQELTGEAAPNQLLDILTAHVSLETAGGTRMFNYNFGGIKGKSPAGETARYMTHEVTETGERKAMSQPFRAYSTLEDGAADYLQVMRARFPEALDQAKGGDPAAFASALKRRGYYTASEASYTSAIKRLTGDSTSTGRVQGVVNANPQSAQAAAVHGYYRQVAAAEAGSSMDPRTDPLLTTAALARVMDAVSEATARIGAPEEAEPKP
jgi:hypothetical protein